MPGPNLLIGNGEVLAGTVLRDGRVGGTKAYPYSIHEARERLREGIAGIAEALDQLPDAAKPRGEGTGLITVHPAFLAFQCLNSMILENRECVQPIFHSVFHSVCRIHRVGRKNRMKN